MNTSVRPIAAALAFIALPAAAADHAELSSVLVTATRTETRVSDVLSDVTVISRDEIRNAAQTTLAELLGRAPGVQFTSNGGPGASGALFIRGTNSEHAVILVDGQRISSATLGTTAIEHIPLDQIDRIEIVRGPASSLYGADAIGGVVQIFTHRGEGKPAPDFSVGYGRYNTVTSSVGYGGQVGDTHFDLRAGREYSGAFSTYRNGTGGFFDPFNPDRDPYENNNFNAQVSHRLSDTAEIGGQFFRVDALKHFDGSNCDTFFSTCTSNFDNRLKQTLSSTSAYVRLKPVAGWTSLVRLGQSEDKMSNWRLDPSVPAELIDRFKTTQDQFTWQNDFALGQAGQLMAAYEWRQEQVNSTQPFTVHSRENRALVAGYQGWFGAHSIQASVRRDQISNFESQTSPNLAYGYEIMPSLSLRAAAGRAYHVPTFNQLYWPADPINFFQGNPNLKAERGYNREVGLKYDRGATQAGLTTYYNRVTDLLNYVPSFVSPYLGQYENVGRATLKGATFTFAQTIGAWHLRTGLDYLNAKDDMTGRALQRRVPRSANVELGYRQGRLETGMQFLAYSGHYNDAANRQWLGGYGLTNLFANYKVDQAWSVLGRINNALDRKYVAVRDPFNGNDYSVPGVSLFVGVRYEPK